MKQSISHLHVLFFPFSVQKATTHAGEKAPNICHQAKTGFHGIFVGILQHQKRNLVYVPHKQKFVSLYDVVFDDIFSSELAYMSQPYE